MEKPYGQWRTESSLSRSPPRSRAFIPSLHPPSYTLSHILLAIKPTPEYVRSLGPSASFVLLAPSVTKNLICFSGGRRDGAIV